MEKEIKEKENKPNQKRLNQELNKPNLKRLSDMDLSEVSGGLLETVIAVGIEYLYQYRGIWLDTYIKENRYEILATLHDAQKH